MTLTNEERYEFQQQCIDDLLEELDQDSAHFLQDFLGLSMHFAHQLVTSFPDQITDWVNDKRDPKIKMYFTIIAKLRIKFCELENICHVKT